MSKRKLVQDLKEFYRFVEDKKLAGQNPYELIDYILLINGKNVDPFHTVDLTRKEAEEAMARWPSLRLVSNRQYSLYGDKIDLYGAQ